MEHVRITLGLRSISTFQATQMRQGRVCALMFLEARAQVFSRWFFVAHRAMIFYASMHRVTLINGHTRSIKEMNQ